MAETDLSLRAWVPCPSQSEPLALHVLICGSDTTGSPLVSGFTFYQWGGCGEVSQVAFGVSRAPGRTSDVCHWRDRGGR